MKRTLLACLFIVGCSGTGPNGSPGSLTGTWELAGATGGATQGMVVITQSRVTITMGGDLFDLQGGSSPTFVWTDHNSAPTITVTHGGGSLDSGIIPLGLGGDWTFTGAQGGSCTASLQSASIVGSCAGAGYGPLFSLNRHATATRTAQLSSVFGDLGGTWTISDDGGGGCTITLQGSIITASCHSQGGSAGGVSMTFGDGVVSGTTDSGAEFSARRQ